MAKQPKGFGPKPKPKSKKKSKQPKSIVLQPLLDIEFLAQKESRLKQIFASEGLIPQVSLQSLQQYHQFLKETLAPGIPLKIDEPVDWEVPFIFGSGTVQTHQSLRQDHPSYLDSYHWVTLEPHIDLATGLQTVVQRSTDAQQFTLPLIGFRIIHSQTTALTDYRLWWEQYRPSFP